MMCVKDGGLFGEQDCCVIASTVCVCEALHDVQQAVTGGGGGVCIWYTAYPPALGLWGFSLLWVPCIGARRQAEVG